MCRLTVPPDRSIIHPLLLVQVGPGCYRERPALSTSTVPMRRRRGCAGLPNQRSALQCKLYPSVHPLRLCAVSSGNHDNMCSGYILRLSSTALPRLLDMHYSSLGLAGNLPAVQDLPAVTRTTPRPPRSPRAEQELGVCERRPPQNPRPRLARSWGALAWSWGWPGDR